MPVLEKSNYQRPFWMVDRHLETIFPATFRQVSVAIQPERIEIPTPDDDFLILDFYRTRGEKLIIISHGLEGDSQRPYVLGLTKKFTSEGWDVLAWNFRGCGGKMNKGLKFYHSGATYDLETVAKYGVKLGYDQIAMTGVSLGGNLTLKFLGEENVPREVRSAAVFSVPLDLAGCSREIDKRHNFLYAHRFLKSLKLKVREKSRAYPEAFDLEELNQLKTIYEFDDVVTAPLGGFSGADDYYQKSSSIHFIPKIKIPTLVVNALNDPFLSNSCYDTTNFETSDNVYFEMPKFGGHVGFSKFGNEGHYWSEERAFEFISKHIESND